MKEEKFIKEKARLPIISKVIFAAAFLLAVFLLALLVQSYIDKKTNGTQKASAIVVMASSLDEAQTIEPEKKPETIEEKAVEVVEVKEAETETPVVEEVVVEKQILEEDNDGVIEEIEQEATEIVEIEGLNETESQEQADVESLPVEQNNETKTLENVFAEKQEGVEAQENEQGASEELSKDGQPVIENQNPPVEISEPAEEEQKENKSENVSLSDNEKYIAIVIDDMGISEKRTRDMISLQVPLTSSFLTYGKNLNGLCEEAIKAGHEIMLHTPMEPKGEASLAPDTLTISMSDEEVGKNFSQMLSKFDEFKIKGINNHMGSRFTESAAKLDVVMSVLKQKNMFFLDSRTSEYTQGEKVAAVEDVPYVARDVFLDNENDYQYIMKQFAKVEKIAQQKGYAIAIGHPKSKTFAALKDWLETLPNKEIKLVHLSEIVDMTSQEN